MTDKPIPDNLLTELIRLLPEKSAATRVISGELMQKIAEIIPSFVGGSADLNPSTKTFLKAFPSIQAKQFEGRNLHYGIREHAMGAINNGIALYGGYIPFSSTFLVFSDYMRPSVRLAALMNVQSIYVFTHDSIFVGEDGPTHQPVEHLAALRTIPNLMVLRPADGIETAVCWSMALRNKKGPSALLLTRQNVTALDREQEFDASLIAKGAYTVSGSKNGKPEIALLASGSEVQAALDAKEILEDDGKSVTVVSVPCKELFEKQSVEYQRRVIPESVKNLVVIETGISFGWQGYFGLPLLMIGMNDFGASGPYKILQEKFGFTGSQIADKVKRFINEREA